MINMNTENEGILVVRMDSEEEMNHVLSLLTTELPPDQVKDYPLENEDLHSTVNTMPKPRPKGWRMVDFMHIHEGAHQYPGFKPRHNDVRYRVYSNSDGKRTCAFCLYRETTGEFSSDEKN